MAKLTTESPICRKIVHSFLEFLDSVEVAQGVDEEGLEVARECLAEAFKVTSDSSRDYRLKPVSLIDMFSSLDQPAPAESETIPSVATRGVAVDDPSSSSGPGLSDSHVQGDASKEPLFTGTSRDELFGKLFGALEKVRYFRNTSGGDDDPAQLEKATKIFHDAINEMEKSGCQTFDVKNLAETLKCQGNKAMQSQLYLEAVELYTFAIALSDKNAVFYCNRAAAYTQINKCTEAINDCHKSIEIDPNYSKAYSRLGLAYYAQGKYVDAIENGFKKALQLDPHNESVKENIRVAEQRLREELQRQRHSQNTSTGHTQVPGMGGHGTTSSFSMPLNPDMMNMFMNMTGNAFPRNQFGNNEGGGGDGNRNGSDEPEVRVGGNINVDLGAGEQMPEDISFAIRSVMHMFGGPQEGSGDNSNNPQDANGAHGNQP